MLAVAQTPASNAVINAERALAAASSWPEIDETANVRSIADSWDDEDAKATPLSPRQITHRAAMAEIEAASKSLNAVLRTSFDDRWDEIAAKYHAAMIASEICDEAYGDAEDEESDVISKASAPIYAVLHDAVDAMRDTPAPDWSGLALKAKALVAMYGGETDSRWCTSALGFAAAADFLGSAPAVTLEAVDVLKARGHAEQLAYYIVRDSDGYQAWGCTGGTIAAVATLVETIVRESRHMARATDAQNALSAAVIGAVWFDEVPGLPEGAGA